MTGDSGTATIQNTLNLAGRVAQQTRPGNGASAAPATFGYDRWGNVTTMTDAAGNVTHDLYDSRNHLIRECAVWCPNRRVVERGGDFFETYRMP